MGDVVNLRQARKRRAKADREAQAQANRVSFGTPKPLRDLAKIEAARRAAALDGARLDGPAGGASQDSVGVPGETFAPRHPTAITIDAPE